MSFFSAIAAFKGAFLGSLLGSHFPQKPGETATTQHPGPAKPCSSHAHPPRPEYGHAHPAKPCHNQPYQQGAVDIQVTRSISYPLFSLNR